RGSSVACWQIIAGSQLPQLGGPRRNAGTVTGGNVVHKVIHFIDSLEFGGTEQALLHLLRGLDPERWQRILFCRSESGVARLLEGAQELGITVRPVARLVGKSVLTDLPRLVRGL